MITITDFYNFSKPVSNVTVWIIVALMISISIAFYVLRSIGLYKLAKNNGQEKAFFAWIPCLWIYLAARLVKEGRFFRTPISKMALIIVIVFSITKILNFAFMFLAYFPLVGYYLSGGEIFYSVGDATVSLKDSMPYWLPNIYVIDSGLPGGFIYPYSNLQLVYTILNVSNYLISILDLASTVFTIFLFINLFRNYWPQHYVLATILSIVGIFAPLVFAIRNKKFVKYKDFAQNRYNSFYYGPQNPYYRNPNTPPPPEHPFEEFAGRGEVDPGDPFEEFSNNNKRDK